MAYDELEEVLLSLAGVIDGDEPVDELSHALQCAGNARSSGASAELIAAALFHDVARSPLVGRDHPGVPHETAAASWLQPRFGAHAAWIAGAHVAAKLYLVESEPGYREHLSAESVRSAVLQGSESYAAFREHRWWRDAVTLRRWDDDAKDPSAVLPGPEEMLRILRPLLLR